MIDLQKLLINKYKQKKLAHFYLLRCSYDHKEASDFLDQWVIKFLKNILNNKIKDQRIEELNHPDILIVNSESGEKYKTKDPGITAFFKFLGLRPFELTHRFIIIKDAHLISTQLGNKFLKSFEGPPLNTTIFLMDPRQQSLLPTITSRSITLNIPTEKKCLTENNAEKPYDFKAYFLNQLRDNELNTSSLEKLLENKSPNIISEILSILKRDKLLTGLFINSTLDYDRIYNDNYEKKERLLEHLKWFDKSVTFSNTPTERLAALLYENLNSIHS